MPEPLIHFAVPFAIMSSRGMKAWRAALISIAAVLPDIDVLLHVHRSYTHSILIPLAIALIAIAFKNRWGVLAALAYASHIALDILTGYTPALWPLTADYLWLKMSLDVHIASLPTLKPTIELLWKPASELTTHFEELEVSAITGEGLAISAVISLAPLIARGASKPKPQSKPEAA